MQCQVFDLLTLQTFAIFPQIWWLADTAPWDRAISLQVRMTLPHLVQGLCESRKFFSNTWTVGILSEVFIFVAETYTWGAFLASEFFGHTYAPSERTDGELLYFHKMARNLLPERPSGRNSFISLTECYKHADSRSILSTFNLAQCIKCMNKTPNGLRALVRGQRRKGGGIAWSESTVERLDPPPGSEADSCFSHLVSYTPPHASREFRHVRMTRSGRSLEVRLHQKPRLSYLCCLSTGSIGYLHAHAHHQQF